MRGRPVEPAPARGPSDDPCDDGAGHLDRLDYSIGGSQCDTRPCTRASSTHYIHVAGFITMGPNDFRNKPSKAYFDDLDQAAAKYITQLEPIAQKCP